MQRILMMILVSVLLIAMPMQVFATLYSYTFSGTASGSIGVETFTETNFSITMIGDTSQVTNGSSPGSFYLNPGVPSTSISINGFSKADFLGATISVDVQNGSGIHGNPPEVSLNNNQHNAITVQDPVFSTWLFTSPLGPITNATIVNSNLINFQNVPSTIGPISFSSMHDVTFLAAPVASVTLPQTGQTTCYDTNGNTISCSGTGQDGAIQAGMQWPNPRFTDNGNQTISDNLTGLIWTKDANLMVTRDPSFDADGTANDGMVTWQHALDYVKKLNTENYLGYNDWRLPNRNELASLANLGQGSNATWLNLPGQSFNNVQPNGYWSSTSFTQATNYAWKVQIDVGIVSLGSQGYGKNLLNNSVWPVRGGQNGSLVSPSTSIPATGQTNCYNTNGAQISCSGTGQDGELQMGVTWPTPRFTDNGNQTISDNLTGLIWTKDANLMVTRDPSFDADGTANDGMVTWQHALDYVKKLNTENYLGYNDWRLPNAIELVSMVNLGQSTPPATWLNTHGFTNAHANYYWSSTNKVSNATTSLLVDMNHGGVETAGDPNNNYINNKILNNFVWPVRGGYISIVNGSCGTSNGATFLVVPANYLCTSGTASVPTGNGPWSWNCIGLNGGTTASCTSTIQSYSVTFLSGGNGTISGSSNQTVNYGGNAAQVTANAANGYQFVNWTGTNGFVTTSANPLTVTNVTNTMSITANFNANLINGSCGSSNGGIFLVAPANNFCTTGTASSVSGSGPWSWSCTGSNGGSTASCSASKSASPTVPVVTAAPPAVNFAGVKTGTTFTIYRSAGGGSFIQVTSSQSTSFTDSSSLLPNTIYTYVVTSDTDPTQTTLMTIRTPLYNGWNIVAVPYQTTGVNPATFFASPVSTIYQWIPSGATPESSNSVLGSYTTVSSLAPGLGYFVKASNSSTLLTYSGTAGPASATVTLNPGWTMIANPNTTNKTNIGTTWMIDGSTQLSAAIGSGKIGSSLYWWNGTTYDFWTVVSNPQVEPWKAYWILNLDSSSHNLTIQ